MKSDCRNFRARLADALRGPAFDPARRPEAGATSGAFGLVWHAHVIHCAECRDLLSEEEALDELLRSLPVPHLPRALAERVLSRLESARRGVDLDRLLDLERAEPAPANLARNVIERVHSEAKLDRLLERVTARTPVGLEKRVLARLEFARRAQRTRTTAAPDSRVATPARPAPRRLALRLAAGFAIVSLAAWGAWSLRRAFFEQATVVPPELVKDSESIRPKPEVVIVPPAESGASVSPQAVPAQPDEELLASLEMFEAWDILATSDGVDASLSTLDSLDEYLLDFESASQSSSNAAPAVPATGSDSRTTPKKG